MTRVNDIPGVVLPGGETVPALGQGTWAMADRPTSRSDEIAALRTGVDLGMTVIDTAEMYANGGAEELVAEALGDRRREIFLVSKVLPHHATRRGTVSSCEASLRRLKTDRLDLYLLHWRGSVPLADTLEAFATLKRDGKIRYWGVSNFDVDDMEELAAMTVKAPSPAASNQVLYNLTRRGIERRLLPWCQTRGIPMMAYSPLEQGKLTTHKTLQALGRRLNATPAQVALAWVLRQDAVIAIPKSGRVDRVRENRGALNVQLGTAELKELDQAFHVPAKNTPLEMI
ncbi:MAG TPA: aldo/keto reductase [Vicinamibacterales bacterium]|nr:aldo/keto reductase [Vicinamibacterales bacterium]